MTDLFYNRKGQSAIEYLMTYGWMLLVVAIVGGAIYATVQSQCAAQATGFTGESVQVDSFEVTPDDTQVVVRNGANEQITITGADLGGEDTMAEADVTLNTGDTAVVTFENMADSDACNDYDLEFTFDRGEITGAVASGSISGNLAPTTA